MGDIGTETQTTHMALPGTVNLSCAILPEVWKEPDVDAAAETAKVIGELNEAISQSDYGRVANQFCKVGYWRDHLMLTWDFRTVQSPAGIQDFLEACSKSKDGFRIQSISSDESSLFRKPVSGAIDRHGEILGITAFLTVKSKLGEGVGYLRLGREDGAWKIFTIYTVLRKLSGVVEESHHRRPLGKTLGPYRDKRNWLERRVAAANYTDGSEPTVLIIG